MVGEEDGLPFGDWSEHQSSLLVFLGFGGDAVGELHVTVSRRLLELLGHRHGTCYVGSALRRHPRQSPDEAPVVGQGLGVREVVVRDSARNGNLEEPVLDVGLLVEIDPVLIIADLRADIRKGSLFPGVYRKKPLTGPRRLRA